MPPAQTAAWRATRHDALRASPWGPLPERVLLTGVPFYPDEGDHCGPAVLAELLGAAGRPVTPEALVPQLLVPDRRGSLQVELLAAARRQQALAMVLPGELDAVLAELADGRPVGVLLNLALSWWTQWHYASVVGIDRVTEEVVLHSGTERAARWPLTTFEHTWARARATGPSP